MDIQLHKKALQIWQPFAKGDSYKTCLKKVKAQVDQEKKITELRERLTNLTKTLNGQKIATKQKHVGFLEGLITMTKTKLDRAILRLEYGDPNRLHPVWGRKLNRYEYLWIGLRKLPYERQVKLVPDNRREFGALIINKHTVDKFEDIHKDWDDMLSKGHDVDADDNRVPNVIPVLQALSTYDSGKNKTPNTNIPDIKYNFKSPESSVFFGSILGTSKANYSA